MNSKSYIEKIIKDTNKAFIEKELLPFLKIPSITLNKEGIKEAKEFLISYIKSFSEDIEEYSGEINPLILARIKGNTKENMLIYMMYDTQPVNKQNEWISDPFGAEIRILPPPLDMLGECIIARGAYNSKTPLMCFLNVVKELKGREELPISLFLLFDAEEEKGSPSLTKFLESNKSLFRNCKDVYYPTAKQDLSGKSVLKLGYKGILSLTIVVYTNNKETHSAFNAMIPNAVIDLISLLNNIYLDNEFFIKSLKNPYRLSEEDNSILQELLKKLDLEKIKTKAGIVEINEVNPKKAFIDYLFKPTFNISTLKSGFLDDGIKNTVPNQALCNIDVRFAHDVSVDKIYKEIQEKVDNFAKKSKCQIKLIYNCGYESSRVNKDSILVKSLIKSFKEYPVEIWPISPAAAPLTKINKILKLNFMSGGLGIGGFAHTTNEFIQYDSIINTRISNYNFLKSYSDLVKKKR